METYITKFNSKRIIRDLDLKNFDVSGEIYRIEFKWFSNYEIKELLAFKMLFANPEEFFKRYIKRPKDSKKYIFEGKNPAYHLSTNCDALLSSFENIKLPEEIIRGGDQVIEEFRKFYKENMHLTEDILIERIRIRFGLLVPLEHVSYDNSGVSYFENVSLDKLEEEIDKLIKKVNSLYRSSDGIKKILDLYGKRSYIEKDNLNLIPHIRKILEDFHYKYKQKISDLLKIYYRVKYNPDLMFKGELLNQLGFVQCAHCYNQNSSQI